MEKNKKIVNRPFILGIIIFIILVLASMLLNNWNIVIAISGVFGGVYFGITAISTGIFVSGNKQRVNFYMMKKEDRIRKDKVATYLFLLGLPNIIGVLIVVMIKR